MIGRLRGLLADISEAHIILDVQGVGYVVYCSAKTLRMFPTKGEEVTLLIETHVREDHIHLYGFTTKEEQEWFNHLITVKGVGTRVAMSILGVLTPTDIIQAILGQEKKAFAQVSGIGARMAERICVELKNKSNVALAELPPIVSNTGATDVAATAIAPDQAVLSDSISALTNLGYTHQQATRIARQIYQEQPEITLNDLIRSSLKQLAV